MTTPTPITVDPIIDPDVLRKDIAIIGSDLDSAFRTQAGTFTEYAMHQFRAEKQLDRLKMALDIKISVADKAIRDRIVTEGGKATEVSISHEITRNPDIVAARLAYNEADGIINLIKNVLEALKQRRDMLVQMGAASREEMKGELRMNAGNSGAQSNELREKAAGLLKQAA